MSYEEDLKPIKVKVDNWQPRKRRVGKTTLKTWVLDPAGIAGPKYAQICDLEPSRVRMTVRPIDIAVTITNDTPVLSPDASTASLAPQGAYLAPSPTGEPPTFYGPDAFWINSLTAVTRVVIVKEYE